MVADGIEFDLRKAGRGEFRGELGLKPGVLQTGSFLGRNLDHGFLAKVTDADDAESMATDGFLRLFDGGEAVGGDGQAGGESGRKAGGGRLLGNFQPGFFGESADIGLGEAGITERGGHGKFPGGGATGSDFAGVVKVFPVGEDGDPAELGQLLHPQEKFRPAEVAAVGRIGGIGGVVQFQGFENFDRQAMFPGEGQGGRMFRAGETGGVAEDAGDLGSEDLMSDPKQEGGVDPARIGHECRRPGPNQVLELPLLGFKIITHGFRELYDEN